LHVQNVVSNHIVSYEPGGSVANTISVVANLGAKSFFTGKAGKDELGIKYLKAMEKAGVTTELAKSNLLTARALTFVTPDSERTFLDYLGAAKEFNKNDLNVIALKGSRIFHISAYFLEEKNLRESAEHAMKIAKENEIKVSIDLGDPLLIKRCKSEILRIINDYADIIFANEEEAKALTDMQSPEEALDLISEMTDIAIVKLGKIGSIIKNNGQIVRIKGVHVETVDSTGAGDAYAGAFLFGLSKGLDLETTGNLASKVAAKVVQKYGARLDDRLNFEELMKEE
jgi:sugar/nucleoside kinase (ribokinase family)